MASKCGSCLRFGLLPVLCLAILGTVEARSKSRSKPREEAPPPPPAGQITDIRFWSSGDSTRIAVETNGAFQFRSDKLANPERIFFDISGAKPPNPSKGIETIAVGDNLVKQIRIAEARAGGTRIVLDLAAHADATSSQLSNPNRLIIEIRSTDKKQSSQNPLAAATDPLRTPNSTAAVTPTSPPTTPPVNTVPAVNTPTVSLNSATPPKNSTAALPKKLPPPAPRPASAMPAIAKVMPPKLDVLMPATTPALEKATRTVVEPPPPIDAPALPKETPRTTAKADAALTAPSLSTSTSISDPLPPPALAAKRSSTGDQSMTRVLGLKLRRVVLDPGHGGHDSGTRGATGLMEKDLVLDVTKRLGALIEARLGSEVVYTRESDTFIPLEERPRIANRHNADLFLSIHANSSPVRAASGIETYYLNFTSSKSALEVAARENASSERSIYELRDLVQKIALKDKLDESREFASKIQTSLSTLSARVNTKSKDRGVKKAPFIVLIGASMPSVLAEVGFVSNPHDEVLMKKGEYRQRIAEALFKGVSQYASSLSHYQVARQKATE